MKNALILLFSLSLINCSGQKAEEYLQTGREKGGNGDHRGAITAYTKAIELGDELRTDRLQYAYYSRAGAKKVLEDQRGAIADYTKAIELDQGGSVTNWSYHRRGNIKKWWLEDYKGAIADFTKAIELNPKYAHAYFDRGISKIALGQLDSGCLDLSKAGELGQNGAYEAIRKLCK